jgi:ABC-2 type transport system ATP-binding protein
VASPGRGDDVDDVRISDARGEHTGDMTTGDQTVTDDQAEQDADGGTLPAAASPSTTPKPRARRTPAPRKRPTRPATPALAPSARDDAAPASQAPASRVEPPEADPPAPSGTTADDATGTVPPVRSEPRDRATGLEARPDSGTSTADPADATADEAPAAPTKAPRKRTPRATAKRPAVQQQPVVLRAEGLVKRYGQTTAVDDVDLEIRQGSIFGVVGPNGAGKTTTLSMVTGLLRPDAGSVTVLDHDVWTDPAAAKRSMGVLPDRLRLFDRLTGAQLLFYSATLRGLDGKTARARSADLAQAFGLGEALGRQVADYSVGMAKKIALAATLIHSPRVLVLDEPFESVDPVSAATITEILRRYASGGGTVVLSSHSMDLVQRTCDSVAIIVGGKVLAAGTMTQVRGRKSLEDKFVELAGGRVVAESMEWLHNFSN